MRRFDSPVIPVAWYYPDGTECSDEHEVVSVRDSAGDITGLRCETTGKPVHSMVREVERLRNELKDVRYELFKADSESHAARAQALELLAGLPTHVYIAESIFPGNPWDSRTRYGVCLNLRSALRALDMFAEEGHPLVATPGEDPEDTDFWNGDDPIRWMVHRPDEVARWDGHLWIFKERIWKR